MRKSEKRHSEKKKNNWRIKRNRGKEKGLKRGEKRNLYRKITRERKDRKKREGVKKKKRNPKRIENIYESPRWESTVQSEMLM